MTKREKRRMKKNDRHMELVENVEPEEKEKKRFKPVELKPRNFKQRRLLAALRNDEKKIVFATGPAGTGKTYMATLYAVQQLQEKVIEKIVITRPAVSVDEQHGFLPGAQIKSNKCSRTKLLKSHPWHICAGEPSKTLSSFSMRRRTRRHPK